MKKIILGLCTIIYCSTYCMQNAKANFAQPRSVQMTQNEEVSKKCCRCKNCYKRYDDTCANCLKRCDNCYEKCDSNCRNRLISCLDTFEWCYDTYVNCCDATHACATCEWEKMNKCQRVACYIICPCTAPCCCEEN